MRESADGDKWSGLLIPLGVGIGVGTDGLGERRSVDVPGLRWIPQWSGKGRHPQKGSPVTAGSD